MLCLPRRVRGFLGHCGRGFSTAARELQRKGTERGWLRTIFICSVALLALLGGARPGLAQEDYPRRLDLATSEDFAPYVYINENGELAGIDYEIVREICRRLGIELKVSLLPRLRITKMLRSGQMDGVVSTTSYNDEAELATMWTSESLYQSSVSVFTLKERQDSEGAASIKSVDLPSVPPAEAVTASARPAESTSCGWPVSAEGSSRVGMLEAFDYSPMGEAEVATLLQNAVTVRTDAQLVNLLLFQRISHAVTEDISFSYQARRMGKFEQLHNCEEVYSRPVKLALSRAVIEGRPGLAEDINRTIDVMTREDFIANVVYQNLRLK